MTTGATAGIPVGVRRYLTNQPAGLAIPTIGAPRRTLLITTCLFPTVRCGAVGAARRGGASPLRWGGTSRVRPPSSRSQALPDLPTRRVGQILAGV